MSCALKLHINISFFAEMSLSSIWHHWKKDWRKITGKLWRESLFTLALMFFLNLYIIIMDWLEIRNPFASYKVLLQVAFKFTTF